MLEHGQPSNFEQDVLPHLDAAYNLARWLMRNEQDAQDIVQEAYLRAFRFFPGFRGGNARAWVMKIVRNICFTWLHANRPLQAATEFDDNFLPPDYHAPNPEELLLQSDSGTLLQQALENLPASLREVLILREIEGMSYREIADVTGVPLGTVMSSLSRARGRLRQTLTSVIRGNKIGGSRQTAAASA
jgi:RNA polymerase sigma-70 factor (ECF subfamily)